MAGFDDEFTSTSILKSHCDYASIEMYIVCYYDSRKAQTTRTFGMLDHIYPFISTMNSLLDHYSFSQHSSSRNETK